MVSRLPRKRPHLCELPLDYPSFEVVNQLMPLWEGNARVIASADNTEAKYFRSEGRLHDARIKSSKLPPCVSGKARFDLKYNNHIPEANISVGLTPAMHAPRVNILEPLRSMVKRREEIVEMLMDLCLIAQPRSLREGISFGGTGEWTCWSKPCFPYPLRRTKTVWSAHRSPIA